MAHLRVVTPGLAIPLLFVHYALVLRARRSGRLGDIAWAAVSLGVLIHAYFYFWTAILPGAALAWVLDAKGRRAFALTVAGGLALGLPAILHNAAIKASTPSDWLLRTEHFLPIARFAHLSIPKVTILVTLALAPWVWLRRRELTYLWCVLASALVLLNHQVLTRLEIENFHYIQSAGLTLSLLLVLVLAPPLFGAPAGSDAAEPPPRLRRAALVGLAVLVAVMVPLAFWFRWEEGYSREVLHFRQLGAELRRDVGTLPAGAVVAGDLHVQLYLAGLQEVYPLTSRLADYAARITDEELDERLVLDAYLKGVGREELLELLDRPPGTLLDERHYEAGLPGFDAVRRRRRELADAIYDDPAAWVRRFGVTHVVLPADAPGTHLDDLGRRVAGGRAWSLWALEPGEPDPSTR
jgi:hypothetical protein